MTPAEIRRALAQAWVDRAYAAIVMEDHYTVALCDEAIKRFTQMQEASQ